MELRRDISRGVTIPLFRGGCERTGRTGHTRSPARHRAVGLGTHLGDHRLLPPCPRASVRGLPDEYAGPRTSAARRPCLSCLCFFASSRLRVKPVLVSMRAQHDALRSRRRVSREGAKTRRDQIGVVASAAPRSREPDSRRGRRVLRRGRPECRVAVRAGGTPLGIERPSQLDPKPQCPSLLCEGLCGLCGSAAIRAK